MSPPRRLRVVVASAAAAILVVALVAAVWSGFGPFPDRDRCTASAAGREIGVSTGEAEGATLVAATAARRGLSARAVTITLAIAHESLADLDRRRVDGILDRLPDDHRRRPVGAMIRAAGGTTQDVAQVADARVLASAVSGQSHAGLTCVAHPDLGTPSHRLTEAGLTPRAAAIRADLDRAFGRLPAGGFAPGGVSSGHMKGSAHYEGRAVDVFVRPISAANKARGWAIASYLVAHADRLGVSHVIFDARIWSSGVRSAQGWRTYSVDTSGRPKATADILLHRDHVHVDVG